MRTLGLILAAIAAIALIVVFIGWVFVLLVIIASVWLVCHLFGTPISIVRVVDGKKYEVGQFRYFRYRANVLPKYVGEEK